MTTAVIVQARMSSSRLPGKVMAPILDRPMLSFQLERLKRSKADEVIVATTNNEADEPIEEVAREYGCRIIWGPEQDVARRYQLAAETYQVDTIIRSTADCPMIDPATVDSVIDRFAVGDVDHVEVLGVPDGMGCEAFRATDLEYAYPFMSDLEREHVTLYFRLRPDQFRLETVKTGLGLEEERWTVDTAADLEFVRTVIEELYPINPEFTIADVTALLATFPKLRTINAHIPMGILDQTLLAAAKGRAIRDFAPMKGDL